jgi:hypothetical protein
MKIYFNGSYAEHYSDFVDEKKVLHKWRKKLFEDTENDQDTTLSEIPVISTHVQQTIKQVTTQFQDDVQVSRKYKSNPVVSRLEKKISENFKEVLKLEFIRLQTNCEPSILLFDEEVSEVCNCSATKTESIKIGTISVVEENNAISNSTLQECKIVLSNCRRLLEETHRFIETTKNDIIDTQKAIEKEVSQKCSEILFDASKSVQRFEEEKGKWFKKKEEDQMKVKQEYQRLRKDRIKVREILNKLKETRNKEIQAISAKLCHDIKKHLSEKYNIPEDEFNFDDE